MRRSALVPRVLGSLLLFLVAAATVTAGDRPKVLRISQDETLMEVVGQNNTFGAQAKQVGYLSRLSGIDSIFSGSPEDETTAEFTFLNDVVNTQVHATGSMRMVQRDGTFTLYRNFAPADFTDLGSFSAGTPILTGISHQQVVLDTTSNSFTVYTDVTVTSSSEFPLDGKSYRLERAGDTFRIIFFGRATGTAIPSAWFGGYAVETKS